MDNPSYLALEALLIRYQNLFLHKPESIPYAEFDAAWPSECIIKSGDHNHSYYWKPVNRSASAIFTELESALEINFHEDIKIFYGSFWSNGICVERHDINFSLIQLWNQEDESQLKENLLGHLFAKIKSKLPLSYFIGCTFGDEIICLDHHTGNIVLEKPGFQAHKVLSEDLASFLISLQPTDDTYNI